MELMALRVGPVPNKCNMSNHGTMALRVGPVPNKGNMSNHDYGIKSGPST